MKVEGKVALVTGGARGIGKEVCELLLEKGAKGVTIVDYNKANGEETEAAFSKKYGTGKATFLQTDVTTDKLEDAFKKTKDVYGRLDIVMNNAGIADETNVQRMISINLIAVITGTQLALKYMGKCNGGNGGVIINTASIAGLRPFWNIPAYSGTKHGVIGFSRAMALQDGSAAQSGYGVRINCLCPHATATNLLGEAKLNFPKETMKRVLDFLNPTNQESWIPVSDVARSCLRLVEDDSLNGACLLVRNSNREELHYPGDSIPSEF